MDVRSIAPLAPRSSQGHCTPAPRALTLSMRRQLKKIRYVSMSFECLLQPWEQHSVYIVLFNLEPWDIDVKIYPQEEEIDTQS